MLRHEQLIGANFSFQHHPFRWAAEELHQMGFKRMALRGIAPLLAILPAHFPAHFPHYADQ